MPSRASISPAHLVLLAVGLVAVAASGPLMAAATMVPALAMSWWRTSLGAVAIAPLALTRHRANLMAMARRELVRSVFAAGRHAAALLDRLVDGLRLRVGGGGEGERRSRLDRGLAHLLRPHADQHQRQLQSFLRGQRAGQPSQRLALAGARRARDHDARPAAERRQPLDRLHGRVLGAELEALAREDGGEVLEARALGDLVGRAAVDGVDADQRREPLRPAGRAHRAGDAVARHQLATFDLGGGDVRRRRSARAAPGG